MRSPQVKTWGLFCVGSGQGKSGLGFYGGKLKLEAQKSIGKDTLAAYYRVKNINLDILQFI